MRPYEGYQLTPGMSKDQPPSRVLIGRAVRDSTEVGKPPQSHP
jgi:hypothetical protein